MGLNNSEAIQPGTNYTFHFSVGIMPGNVAVNDVVAADSNFVNPVSAVESGGFQINFTYNGQGSTIGDAGREMEQVLNDSWSLLGFFNSVLFKYADAGDAAPTAPGGGSDASTWLWGVFIVLGLVLAIKVMPEGALSGYLKKKGK